MPASPAASSSRSFWTSASRESSCALLCASVSLTFFSSASRSLMLLRLFSTSRLAAPNSLLFFDACSLLWALLSASRSRSIISCCDFRQVSVSASFARSTSSIPCSFARSRRSGSSLAGSCLAAEVQLAHLHVAGLELQQIQELFAQERDLSLLSVRWAHLGSNQGPTGYEPAALTD